MVMSRTRALEVSIHAVSPALIFAASIDPGAVIGVATGIATGAGGGDVAAGRVALIAGDCAGTSVAVSAADTIDVDSIDSTNVTRTITENGRFFISLFHE
ncbi:hypothetical protein GCM10022212_26380 [Actimicrobium antarcticum]|uniref:Uncharacterized protein n=1 Tax=Actimicrobium antarcticum TaxID=1051899 RepID=A0ABP7TIZ2_9BURK